MADPKRDDQSKTDELVAAMVLHQIFLTRAAGGIAREANQTIDASQARVGQAIRGRLANAPVGLRSPRALRRLSALLGVIGTARSAAWASARAQILGALGDLARYESEFYGRLISRIAGEDLIAPAASTIREILRSTPLEGRSLPDWLRHIEAEDARRIEASVRAGMVSGESAEQIAQRVLGRGSLRGRDGVTQLTRNQVEALTRTATAQVTAEMDREIARANRSLFAGERYTAVLDSRTTPLCRSLDGRIFPVAEGPHPPLHWNCRSRRVPIFKGDQPSDLPTYAEWLRSMPAAVQNEILGPTRARLFRKGGLTLDRFVNRAGDQVPLKDLAKLEADAFSRAGIQI